ncbi:hypothetical protein O6H91_06G066800 [Diphasiastrum complanatum]|uniref:Uncharacterized protein n=1 Tax=Diphasiastrum complanatum TaxID=34168 RepID=A0ACC2DEL5_DIPCM|nr:hypothetical protein O6H91_06G066800 [Diphasiastrum complanatum]
MSSLLKMRQYGFQMHQVQPYIQAKKQLRKLWHVVKRLIKVKLKTARRAIGFIHPEAEILALHFHSITLERANIVVHLRVKNPNLFAVHLADTEFVLENEGIKLVETKVDHAQTIKLKSSLNVDISLDLIYSDLEIRCPSVEPGMVVPYTFKADLSFKEPLMALYRFKLEKTGDLPVPTAPEICIQEIAFDRFSFARSDAKVRLRILNRNQFSLSMVGLQFNIILGGIPLVKATVGESVVIQSYDFHVLDAPISFHPREFGGALWHVIGGTRSAYELFGKLEAQTSFGTLHLPFNTQGLDTKLETKSPYEPD